MAGVSGPDAAPAWDWRLLRAAVVQTGEVTLDDVPRRHIADLAAAASKAGLRVTVNGSQVTLSLLPGLTARERAPPVTRLVTLEEACRAAQQIAQEAGRAVCREAVEAMQEQHRRAVERVLDNTGE